MTTISTSEAKDETDEVARIVEPCEARITTVEMCGPQTVGYGGSSISIADLHIGLTS
jgi:hypothetical protein